MRLSVSEAAKRAGVSVRTLHYYDEIGLLKPSETTQAGYRFYNETAMASLQQILFYRELDVPLEQIGRILDAPDNDRTEALQKHRTLLMMKRRRLDDMLRLVDETIGGIAMYDQRPKPTQEDWEAVKNQYAQEAADRWGNTEAFLESREKHAQYTPEQEAQINAEMEEIFQAFGACADPEGEEGQALVKRWQAHITRYHYNCTDSILACLGQMYANDPRFKENLDKYGPGTAQKMSDAIAAYCKK
ncbi:MAG: MerR family transcriptional regulator [Oscillospiraceae bacterium]|nr:MerR family transcriptional regulator [Oscillospiraceae bacterium]